VASGAMLSTAAPPAHALDTGYQKVLEHTLFQAVNQPINNFKIAPDGVTRTLDPTCPTFPGVHRTSKIWYAVYGKADTSLNTSAYAKVRMNLTTTYSPAVAAAKVAYMQVGINASCDLLNTFDGEGVVGAEQGIACSVWYPQRPTRWCSIAATNSGDPALNVGLAQECSEKAGGPYPAVWHEWHDLNGHLFTYNLYNKQITEIAGTAVQAIATYFGAADIGSALKKVLNVVPANIPVAIDDVTTLGGVSNFDLASGQPANNGTSWLGYGHIQSPGVSEAVIRWFDSAAKRLGQDPMNYPTKAHTFVESAIAKHQANPSKYPAPLGSINAGGPLIQHNQLIDAACAFSYGMRDLLDPYTAVSYSGFGEDIQGLTYNLTGQNFCDRQVANGRTALAKNACNNVWVGYLFGAIDNNNPMYPANSDVAAQLNVNLGNTRDQHMKNLALRYWQLIA